MVFSQQASLKGSDNAYQINEDCKKFTLRDYGFTTTKVGNFLYETAVKPSFGDSREVLLKVTINKEVEGLMLAVTNKAGLQALDIYNNEAMAPFAKQVDYILKDMVERSVLAPVV